MQGENLESPLFHLAREVNSITDKNDLIIGINNGSPLIFYSSNRKGWNAYADKISRDFVEDKIDKGAKYLIGEYSYFNDIEKSLVLKEIFRNYKFIINRKEYFIIKLI
jgi:hypothetical protein